MVSNVLKAFSIFDDKATVFNTPFFSINESVARRDFTRLVQDESSIIHVSPVDFHLYEVGSFDDDSGIFAVYDKPVFVCHAVSCIKPLPLTANANVAE
jgi:hypothetical protein